MTLDRSTLRWNGWGFARHDDHFAGADKLWSFLAEALGSGPLPHTPAKPLAECKLASSSLAFGDLAPFQQAIPSVATAEQPAASITFLLSDDGVNINGAILASDSGWSVQ